MLESSLDKIAEQILHLDEASLVNLWEKYHRRMEQFEPTREWEKSVIIFFLINAVRVKNHVFNEQVMKSRNPSSATATEPPSVPPRTKPHLRRVK